MKVSISAERRWRLPILIISGLMMPATSMGFPDLIEDPLGVRPSRMLTGTFLPQGRSVGSVSPVDLPQPLELGAAIDIALSNNAQICSAWAEIKSQAAAKGQARSEYFPIIRVSVSRLGNWSATSSESGYDESYLSGVQFYGVLTWKMLDFGGRSANNKAGTQLLEAALASYDAVIQQAIGSVIQAYFDAMTAQSEFDAKKKMTCIAGQMLLATERREVHGVSSLSDKLQAETALAKARINEVRAEGEFKKSLSLLIQIMGLTQGTTVTLPHNLKLDRIDEVTSLNEWLSEAEKAHPAIRQARARLAADKAKIAVVRAEGLPSLDATASFSRNGYPNQGLSSEGQSVTTVGVTLNIPIFDGFDRTYRIRQAQALAEQSQIRLQETTNQVLTEVVKSHADAISSLQTMKAVDRLMLVATRSFESSLRRYQRNAADILELLETQSALADAQMERIRALADLHSARLRLMANTGILGLDELLRSQQ